MMVTTANWLVSAGFCLVLLGVALRIITMMRASDAAHFSAAPHVKYGRELLGSYRTYYPGNALPMIAAVMMATGGTALIAGAAVLLKL